MAKRVSVLFVCLGNICRSPTAEAVFSHLVEERGLSGRVEVDSAGTGSWHIGHPPDPRAVAAAKERGYDLSPLRARQVTAQECGEHDFVVVMDSENLANVQRLCPESNVHRLMDFAPNLEVDDVPDPYYGDEDSFDEVLDLIEEATEGLLEAVEARLNGVAA